MVNSYDVELPNYLSKGIEKITIKNYNYGGHFFPGDSYNVIEVTAVMSDITTSDMPLSLIWYIPLSVLVILNLPQVFYIIDSVLPAAFCDESTNHSYYLLIVASYSHS